MIKITDPRIGVRDLQGRMVQYPQKFVNGAPWSRTANPTPSMVFFGPSDRYFYILPMGHVRITDELKETLLAIVTAGMPAKVVDNPPIVQAPDEKPANEKMDKIEAQPAIQPETATIDVAVDTSEEVKTTASSIVVPKVKPTKTNMRKTTKVSIHDTDN